jgi:predicted nucleic acid-binding protein
VKLFVAEPGEEDVRALWAQADELVTASVTFVEARSAIARRLRGRARSRARRILNTHWSELTAIDVDDHLLQLAAAAVDQHGLRALDAIHLAAGRLSAEGEFLFGTFDHELRGAAMAAGFAIAPAGVS